MASRYWASKSLRILYILGRHSREIQYSISMDMTEYNGLNESLIEKGPEQEMKDVCDHLIPFVKSSGIVYRIWLE